MPQFGLVSDFRMTGDQPQAVEGLVEVKSMALTGKGDTLFQLKNEPE